MGRRCGCESAEDVGVVGVREGREGGVGAGNVDAGGVKVERKGGWIGLFDGEVHIVVAWGL